MHHPEFRHVLALVDELRSDPKRFFESESYQSESIILEYKSSFGFDAALSRCPYAQVGSTFRHNDALVMRILDTIMSFANRQGGIIVLGVAEAHAEVIEDTDKRKCAALHGGVARPCQAGSDADSGHRIKSLRIVGIQDELAGQGMDFDSFQRMIQDRFSLGAGAHAAQGIKFQPIPYPCGPERKKNSGVTYVPSMSPADLIKDILRIDQTLADSSYLLCAIVVEPSVEPVTVKVREGDSYNLKHIFPVRQAGKNESIEDHQRIFEYIAKRFPGYNNEAMFASFERKLDAIASRLLPPGPTWHGVVQDGASVALASGISSTLSSLNGCSPAWFSGDMTVILGAGEVDQSRTEQTRASWCIDLQSADRTRFRTGYLLIGCQRFFGGLHSSRYGAQVEIMVNGRPIDGFSLMVIPPDHTDYFHRIPHPKIPVDPFEDCPTLYAWRIRKDQLNTEGAQVITVCLDSDVAWDVDYVGIVWKV